MKRRASLKWTTTSAVSFMVAQLMPISASAAGAATKPEVISALSLQRPAHDITVSKSGRIFMLMVDAPWLVQWVNGELRAYPDTRWNDAKAADHSHALVRPTSLRIEPDGLLWVLDTGQPGMDHGGPKFVAFDLETNSLVRSYPLDAGAVTGSFYDDFRFNGRNVYFTDIGHGAILVLNLDTAALRRTLDGDPSTKGTRPMIVEGKELPPLFGLGHILDVDMLELSADGRWLYYQPTAGPMSRIETRWIDDPQINDAERGKHVHFWADTHSTGATAIDDKGNIYASDVDKKRLLKIDPTGKISSFVADPRMLFVDEMWIDEKGFLWMPADQLNRVLFKDIWPPPQLPFQVLKVQTGQSRSVVKENKMRDYRNIYIDGKWVLPSGGEVVDIINPATERPVGQITLATAADVDRAVAAARTAFRTFSQTSREERCELLSNIRATYAKRHQDLADAMVEELGAPAKFAKDVQAAIGDLHLQTAIKALRTYAFEHSQSGRTTVRREPIGVVGMITPWNWPINQVMCKVVPALATGNTMVHKPSEVAPFTAHIIAEILQDGGVPKGVYNLVDGDGPTVGAAISGHPAIDMVSFTGSTRAGIDVAKRAADSVKRVHQELGGKSPNIVLDDADLAKAVTENIYRLMMNSGQSCHAPTRLLVPAEKLKEAKAIAARVAQSITVGDPTGDVYMGPVVSERQWNRIQLLIRKGVEEGATLVAGGEGRPDGLDRGYYVRPTIFADVTNQMTIAREEIFGPVLCILAYHDLEDAVAIANDTDYGLAAYVQSASDARAEEVAARLEAGVILLNGAQEDPEAPFGGYKKSGNGREWGEIAFGEFLETKAVTHREVARSRTGAGAGRQPETV